MERLLIVDESMSSRISTMLGRRGRPTMSHKGARTSGLQDVPMLRKLEKIEEPWVLVTADDKMPSEHAKIIAEIGATIATIDGHWEQLIAQHGLCQTTEDQFHWETVNRWAHVMQAQQDGEIRRYNPIRHNKWTPRKRYS